MYKVFVQTFNRAMSTGTASAPRKTAGKPVAVVAATRPDRRLAILLAAERLFAQHGYHAVSIRQIAQAAGVPLALVGYYFGPKHELFHAIFEHWQGTAQARLERLDTALHAPEPARSLERVVEAFVRPVLAQRASEEGEYYAQLVARELGFQTPEATRVLTDYFDPLANRFIDALMAVRPGHGRDLAAWAYQFALGALLHHISDIRVGRLSGGLNTPNDADAAPLLIRFLCAGIDAVMPAQPHGHPPPA
jgi:AcrR family transcriptional regulator